MKARRDYLQHLFTAGDLRWFSGITEGQYRYWLDAGLIRPGYVDRPGESYGRIFTFADLVAVRIMRELRDQGVPLDPLREIPAWVRAQVDRGMPWSELCLYIADGHEVVFRKPEPADSAQVVRVGPIVEQLIWKLEHRREIAGQIGRIEKRRDVQGGQPVVAGTRVTVSAIKSFHEAGYPVDEIQRQYPHVTLKDIQAAIAYNEDRVEAAVAD